METPTVTKEFLEFSQWIFHSILKDNPAAKLAALGVEPDALTLQAIEAFISKEIDYARMQSVSAYFDLWGKIESALIHNLRKIDGRVHRINDKPWNQGIFCRFVELHASNGNAIFGNSVVEVTWFSIHHMTGVTTSVEELNAFLSGKTGIVVFETGSHRVVLIPCYDAQSMVVACGYFDVIHNGYFISGDGKDRGSGGLLGMLVSQAEQSILTAAMIDSALFADDFIEKIAKIRTIVKEVESLTDMNGNGLLVHFTARGLGFVTRENNQPNHSQDFVINSLLETGFHESSDWSMRFVRDDFAFALSYARDWAGLYGLWMPH